LPTGPDHVPDIGIFNDAVVCTLSGGQHRQRRVVVAVTDRGRWAAYHPDSPAPQARGHGLAMMSGCMAELHIQRSVAGTTVIMISATAGS
jgi:anti-sigma regulatory factor (Ser/Thr protein kinase)